MSENIEQRMAVWGDFRFKVLEDSAMVGVSGKKRKRGDPHYKSLVVESKQVRKAMECNEELAGGSKKTSTGRTWQLAHMAEYRALGLMMEDASRGVLHIAFDGARIGRPAVEILAGVAYWPGEGCYVLPPAAFLLKNQLPLAA